MSQITVKHFARYDLYYQSDDTSECEQTILLRHEMHDGYYLYRVKATYAKPLAPCNYFVIARNKTEARSIFKGICPWISLISEINQVDNDATQIILSSPKEYVVI